MAFHKALKDAGIHPPLSSDLFKDLHNLQGVCTHPLMLDMKKNDQKVESDSEGDESEGDDESDDDNNSEDGEDKSVPGTSEWNAYRYM